MWKKSLKKSKQNNKLTLGKSNNWTEEWLIVLFAQLIQMSVVSDSLRFVWSDFEWDCRSLPGNPKRFSMSSNSWNKGMKWLLFVKIITTLIVLKPISLKRIIDDDHTSYTTSSTIFKIWINEIEYW